MKVANVFVNKYEKGKLLGFADIMFSLRDDGDGCLTIKGFKIFRDEKTGGIQVAAPAKQDNEGKWFPFVKVELDNQDGKDFMDHINDAVASKYNSLSATKHSEKKQQSNNNSGGGIGDSDIPF